MKTPILFHAFLGATLLLTGFLLGYRAGSTERAPEPILAPQYGTLNTMEYRPGPEARQEKALSFQF